MPYEPTATTSRTGASAVGNNATGVGTLHDFTHQTVLRAEHGQNGMGKDCYGRAGKDLIVRVPVGTIV